MLRSALMMMVTAITVSSACGSSRNQLSERGDLPADKNLRGALSGRFHGYWTGAASGTVLRDRDGSLLEIPIVLDADLSDQIHWDMDATDFGEVILERAGHYNSSVWFVSEQIEVVGRNIYITKFEDSYEDTLCLELVGYQPDGSMRFQVYSYLADPGEGERDACLNGAAPYDASLLLKRGPGNAPEFVETGRSPGDYGASPDDPELWDEDEDLEDHEHEDEDEDWEEDEGWEGDEARVRAATGPGPA